jgi:hypothetical protein
MRRHRMSELPYCCELANNELVEKIVEYIDDHFIDTDHLIEITDGIEEKFKKELD